MVRDVPSRPRVPRDARPAAWCDRAGWCKGSYFVTFSLTALVVEALKLVPPENVALIL